MKSVTTVLMVENDAVALTMYQKRLQREGFHVEVAEDGIAALKVLSEITPDVVILDLMLPKFSGRDVFDYMRADAQFKNVPVIIFSNAPKSEWPQNPEASPTRTLPKSEANFAALLELMREMTVAVPSAPAPASAPVPAAIPTPSAPVDTVPEPEPTLVLHTANSTATGAESAGTTNEISTPETPQKFLEHVIADLPMLRERCLAYIKTPSTDALAALRQRINDLNTGAQKTGCARLGLLAAAWEALLAEIERKPKTATPSILQTLAQAADCLRVLLNSDNIGSTVPLPKARALSVDDDEICNQVAVSALQRANIGADSAPDAFAALELLKRNNYDLVLLDINMPGLTGFELCEKLRALPLHETTPVIFVTAFNNFENRKQSVLSGGGDLIAKPVSPLELALKVTIHLLKAPPKFTVTPVTPAEPEPALVWKEPAETFSHDTESFVKEPTAIKPSPGLMTPTTETHTGDPETPGNEPAKPTLELKPEADNSPAEILKPITVIPAIPVAELKMTVETKADEPKILASIVEPRPLPDVGKLAHIQPAEIIEPPLPISRGKNKEKTPMNKESNPKFDTLVADVANIIFGDNPPDINVRLVRMALEKVWQNRAELQSIDALAREIAQIIFGETNTSDLNIRLVRMALERSNSIALFKAA